MNLFYCMNVIAWSVCPKLICVDHDCAYGNAGTWMDVFYLLDFGFAFNLMDCSFKDGHET